MKKRIILLIFAFGLINTIKAQGNLQFNKVVNFTFTKNLMPNEGRDTIITIPANKIWKIESISSGYYNETTNLNINSSMPFPNGTVFLNGTIIYGLNPNNNAMFYSVPIYLQPGSSNTFGLKSGGGLSFLGPLAFRFFISAIEYNIVP